MKSRNIIGSRRSERGVSLLIVLVLLLVMTLLGLAILRGTMMEERMTANMYERSLAFQSAESALRAGEAIASATPVAPASGCNAAGVCAPPNPTDADRWLNSSFTGWVTAPAIAGATPAPPPSAYFVEYMGEAPSWPGCDRQVPMHSLCMAPSYRVTARSTDVDRATVILQSNFVVQ
jgi:type IV pilus assembly protein PilX